MDDSSLTRLRARAAAEICRECDLETDVAASLKAAPDAAQFLRQLLAAEAHRDAVQFLCHALEPREVVWWATLCVETIDAAALSGDEAAALAATRAWLAAPDDGRRRAAQAAADKCGVGKPAGCLALAVFLAEGSLGPRDLAKEVPVPPFACAKAGAGAILLAAVREPVRAAARCGEFVELWFRAAATPPPWSHPVASAAAPVPRKKA